MTKTLQRLLLCNVTEKKCKICRCRPEHAFDIHLPLGFLVYRVSSNFKSIWVSQSSFPTGFAPWWPCYSLDLFQSGQNLSHQHILVVVYGLIVKSCPTLCDPMDYSLPGSSVHGILQARLSEQVAISFSIVSSPARDQTCVSCISCTGRCILHHGTTWEAHKRHTIPTFFTSALLGPFLAAILQEEGQ